MCGSLVSHKTFVACKIQYTHYSFCFLFWTSFCGIISRKYYNWKEQKIQETHVVYSKTSQKCFDGMLETFKYNNNI